MSNYKSIGANSDFKPPQPWIFKPVQAYQYKLILRVLLILVIVYIFMISVDFFGGSQEKSLVFFTVVTIAIVFYAIIGLIYINLFFKTIEYQVHGTEIVVKKGLFNITENHIPFSNITNIALRQGPFDKLFGIGTIKVFTGGAQLNTFRVGEIAGTRIYEDVGYFILSQIKTYETFFTYLLGENSRPKNKLNKEFWIEFSNLVKNIKEELENG